MLPTFFLTLKIQTNWRTAVIMPQLKNSTLNISSGRWLKCQKYSHWELARPFDAYDNTDGKGYGKRGGQDLVLIKLQKATRFLPACLPDPNFEDINIKAILAGYGKYFRASCQTDTRGPMKHHYCQSDPDCVQNNCKPKFHDGLRLHRDCDRKGKTPARWSRMCSK